MLSGRNEAVRAVEVDLQLWLDWTLYQVCPPPGLSAGWLPSPASWKRPVTDSIPADGHLPLVTVTCPSALDRTSRDDGQVDGTYTVVVNALVRGRDWESTADLIGGYGTAIRALLERNSVVDVVTAEEYAPAFDARNGRTLAEVVISCEVTGCVADLIWPDEPTDPPADSAVIGTVVTTNVTTSTE